jgi:hypothetical protein
VVALEKQAAQMGMVKAVMDWLGLTELLAQEAEGAQTHHLAHLEAMVAVAMAVLV